AIPLFWQLSEGAEVQPAFKAPPLAGGSTDSVEILPSFGAQVVEAPALFSELWFQQPCAERLVTSRFSARRAPRSSRTLRNCPGIRASRSCLGTDSTRSLMSARPAVVIWTI